MRFHGNMSPKGSLLRHPSFVVILTSAIIATGLVTFLITTYLNANVVTRSTVISRNEEEKQCEFPILYNKPPKTASSFIQTVIVNWSQQVGRPYYLCAETPLLTSVILPDCIPEVGNSCAVFSSHIFFNNRARKFFDERMPGFKLVTSTRYPPHRIISMYMFINNLREDDPKVYDGLDYYLDNFNPWRQFNYLTGETRTGECPLTYEDRRDIANVASFFDIVIDVNALEESNAILKHFNIFTLPTVNDSSQKEKHLGAAKLKLSEKHLTKLRSKVCVEEDLHRAFQVRMASLYQKISGVSCHHDAHWQKIENCIMEKERQTLRGSWTL